MTGGATVRRLVWCGCAAALALGTLGTSPVGTQPLPPQERRTVSWYVANPWALEAVTRACRDNPGRLRASPDCVNADQARIVVAEQEARTRAGIGSPSPLGPSETDRTRQAAAEARRNLGDLTPPSSPRYWESRPMERARQLAHCSRLTTEQQSHFFCDAAKAAELAATAKGSSW